MYVVQQGPVLRVNPKTVRQYDLAHNVHAAYLGSFAVWISRLVGWRDTR